VCLLALGGIFQGRARLSGYSVGDGGNEVTEIKVDSIRLRCLVCEARYKEEEVVIPLEFPMELEVTATTEISDGLWQFLQNHGKEHHAPE